MVRALTMAILAGSFVTLASVGGAAEPPPSSAPAANPPADADALRGPALNKHSERPERSIVERDFNGKPKKLGDNPALVALRRLEMTAQERSAVDKVVGDRAAAIDAIVRDNLRLLVEFGQAKQAGDSEDTNRLQAQVMEKASPFLRRGPLIAELRPALSDEKFAELKRMVDEYNKVSAQDRMADPMAGPKKDNKLGAMLAQGAEGFLAEAKASYERVVQAGGKDFENLIKVLELTPQQESKVRQIVMDLFQKTYGKLTKGQQIKVFLEIYAELDTGQRHRLAEHIGEENRVKRGVGKKP